MNFKDLKPGYSIYILDKNELTAESKKILTVSLPHADKNYNAIMSMCVDLTIEDLPQTYTFKDDSNVGYTSNYVISTDKEVILREVESIKSINESLLNKVDKYKEDVDKCNKLLIDLNPAFKEKKETDERLNTLEQSINNLTELMQKLISEHNT